MKGNCAPFPHLLNIRHLMGYFVYTSFLSFPVEFKWYVGENTALVYVKEYSTWNNGGKLYI